MERATKCDRKANGMVHMKTKQKRHNGSQIKYTNMNECVCVCIKKTTATMKQMMCRRWHKTGVFLITKSSWCDSMLFFSLHGNWQANETFVTISSTD